VGTFLRQSVVPGNLQCAHYKTDEHRCSPVVNKIIKIRSYFKSKATVNFRMSSAVFWTPLGLPRLANLHVVCSMRRDRRPRRHVHRTFCAAVAVWSPSTTLIEGWNVSDRHRRAQRLLDNSRICQLADCQLADWTTRGLDISRTRQLAYWTSRRLDNSRMPPATLRA